MYYLGVIFIIHTLLGTTTTTTTTTTNIIHYLFIRSIYYLGVLYNSYSCFLGGFFIHYSYLLLLCTIYYVLFIRSIYYLLYYSLLIFIINYLWSIYYLFLLLIRCIIYYGSRETMSRFGIDVGDGVHYIINISLVVIIFISLSF